MLNCTLYAALSLYEENFSKLMLLLEGLESVEGSAALIAEGMPRLELTVVERSAYTATVTLSQSLGEQPHLVRALHMKIRIYLDAQVAEVLAYQQAAQFQAFYPYPNPHMFQPYEKRRVNQFLGEWLSYCLQIGYRLVPACRSSLQVSFFPPFRS